MGNHSATRKRKREGERDALQKRATLFVVLLGNHLSALVVAGKVSVVVLPYYSEQALRMEGVDVTGKAFAKFEDLQHGS